MTQRNTQQHRKTKCGYIKQRQKTEETSAEQTVEKKAAGGAAVD